MISLYRSFAEKLSYIYPFYGSGADEQDVYQVAMMAAWVAVRDEPGIDPRFVRRRMKLRVLDFVRLRKGQPRFERETVPLLLDIEGNDSTVEKIIIRDELKCLVTAVSKLPKKQRFYLAGHLNGFEHKTMGNASTVDVMLSRTRRRIEQELAA